MLKKLWREIRLTFVSEFEQRRRIIDNLSRFPENHQEAVLTLAAKHDRLAELAASFPALLFALAITKNEPCAKQVSQGIFDGRPLADLAEIGSVPLWLRKLPPEAFTQRLPQLPDDAAFRVRIANHLPRQPAYAAKWLKQLGRAVNWCDEDFAIWLVRAINANPDLEISGKWLFKLALYAWFSRHPETFAGQLIETRWNPKMTYAAATDGLHQWRENARTHLLLESVEPEKPWVQQTVQGEYQFEPILSATALISEAIAMENCIRSYSDEIAMRETQFWVIKKDNKRLAHCAIGHKWREPLPSITEIYGPNNAEVSAEVYRAAWVWLINANLPDLRPNERQLSDIKIDRDVWAKFWRPYWLAKKRLPQRLPMAPSLERI